MDNLTKAEKQLLGELRREARERARECYHPDCTLETIASHLFQRNGVTLKSIAQSGHIYALLEDNLIKPEGEPYYFERLGVGKYQIFQGFCREHDDQVFAEIEKRPFRINNRVQWLFAYRGLVNEYNKQQNNLFWYEKMRLNQATVEIYDQVYKAIDLEMKFLFETTAFVKSLFDEKLFSHTKKFDYVFRSREIPKIPLITSATFVHPIKYKYDTAKPIPEKDLEFFSRQSIFVNVIATAKKHYLSIGYHPDNSNPESLRLISMFKEGKWREILNEALIKYCETWAFSETFYENSIKPREKEILDEIHRLRLNKNQPLEIELIRQEDIPS